MNLFRKNVFHIFTLTLFMGLLVHCWYNPDTLGWAVLFLLIMLNAVLFIIHKPVSMISWITIVIGILGILMSIPDIISSGIRYFNDQPAGTTPGDQSFPPALYFSISTLFSFLQIHRIIRA